MKLYTRHGTQGIVGNQHSGKIPKIKMPAFVKLFSAIESHVGGREKAVAFIGGNTAEYSYMLKGDSISGAYAKKLLMAWRKVEKEKQSQSILAAKQS